MNWSFTISPVVFVPDSSLNISLVAPVNKSQYDQLSNINFSALINSTYNISHTNFTINGVHYKNSTILGNGTNKRVGLNVTLWIPGKYTWYVTALDSNNGVGNSTTNHSTDYNWTFYINPRASINLTNTLPTDAVAFDYGSNVNFSVTVNSVYDIDYVNFTINGTNYQNTTNINNGTNINSSYGGVLLSPGTYYWVALAFDITQNQSTSGDNFTFIIRAFPVINTPTIISPSNATNTSDTTPQIGFNITGTNSTYNYTIFVGSTNETAGNVNNNTNTYYNLTALTNGIHNIVVEGAINNQNHTNSSILTITVDDTNPVVNLNNPENGDITSDTTPEIRCNATDNISITLVAQIFVDGSADGGNFSINNNTETYRNLSTLINGNHNITVQALDPAGNAQNSTLINITLSDNIAPGIINIIESVTITTATINWNTTEVANSTVNYGLNTSLLNISSLTDYATNHSITISSLVASTLYYYNLTSCDQNENCNTTGIFNFTTSTQSTEGTNAGTSGGSSGGGGGGGDRLPVIEVDNQTEEGPVTETNEYFDISLDLVKSRIIVGESLDVNVLINRKELATIGSNIELIYTITDKDGNILYEESEVITIQNQLEFNKKFDLETISDGEYKISLKVRYNNEDISVITKDFLIGRTLKGDVLLWILVVVIGLYGLGFVGYSIYKIIKKNQLKSKKMSEFKV